MLDSKLADWISDKTRAPPPSRSTKELQKLRAKERVAVTFNKLGIVVPYDKKTELGYRPLPMTDSE